jgi:hypothetical protein
VRVSDDLATCPACGATHPFSTLLRRGPGSADAAPPAPERRPAGPPPAGAWQRYEADRIHLGATHRSIPGALAALGIALFWNGIVGVFVFFALAGTLLALGLPLPEVAHNIRFESGSDGLPSGGMLVFLWLFLTPFIAVGAFLAWAFLHLVGGRTEVIIAPSGATLFSGVGPLGRTHTFDPASVRAVELEEKTSTDSEGDSSTTTHLVLKRDGAKDLRFGSHLSETRRLYLLAALREVLGR